MISQLGVPKILSKSSSRYLSPFYREITRYGTRIRSRERNYLPRANSYGMQTFDNKEFFQTQCIYPYNVVILTSTKMLNHLSGARQLFLDETFRVAPTGFKQFIVIRARNNDTNMFLPVLYGVMQTKELNNYLEFFSLLQFITPRIETEFITIDFEINLKTSMDSKKEKKSLLLVLFFIGIKDGILHLRSKSKQLKCIWILIKIFFGNYSKIGDHFGVSFQTIKNWV
ncbi:hypothetical protein M0811_04661 [Anaeramoeba ignava]|uniref:MULE transposase domain-containing protein n=1 Tax=Anaeramoeba ignava TaxID=1746090 RepID=A0A9Q0LWX7_ANAIG|nr:hypothetical protein M0811_04661 [Anaeramoeba ignava]